MAGHRARSPPSPQSNLNQPEFARPIWSYLDSAVSARRIADAKFHAGALCRRAAGHRNQSGVPKEILVAIWGMETDYGRDAGGYQSLRHAGHPGL